MFWQHWMVSPLVLRQTAWSLLAHSVEAVEALGLVEFKPAASEFSLKAQEVLHLLHDCPGLGAEPVALKEEELIQTEEFEPTLKVLIVNPTCKSAIAHRHIHLVKHMFHWFGWHAFLKTLLACVYLKDI